MSEAKFKLGDEVFVATTAVEKKKAPCPDCKDTRIWEAISPAGGKYEFRCPRCSSSYHSDRDLQLEYYHHQPDVTAITIRNVRFDSREPAGSQWTYMASATGSGFVFKEKDLHLDKELALKAAQAKADSANFNIPQKQQELFKGRIDLSDYQLSDAKSKNAIDKLRDFRYRVQDAIEEIDDDDLRASIQERIGAEE